MPGGGEAALDCYQPAEFVEHDEVEAGRFDAARTLLIAARAVLSGNTHDKLAHYIVDRRAGIPVKAGDLRRAAQI